MSLLSYWALELLQLGVPVEILRPIVVALVVAAEAILAIPFSMVAIPLATFHPPEP